MKYIVLGAALGFASVLTACGPSPEQRAFMAEISAKCQAGDMVACHQRDGDPVEVARLEAACQNQNLQACNSVANYRVRQQQVNYQAQAALASTVQSIASQPRVQYPTFEAPQAQQYHLPNTTQHYYCNQLGSYVITCR